MAKVLKNKSIVLDYEISNVVLGKGVDGNILLIQNKTTGIKYSLKSLIASKKSRNEINLHYLASLNCDQVVKLVEVYENFIDGNLFYFVVMEYMEGGTLANKITTTKLNEKEIIFIMKQLFAAVEHLHSIKIVHCDIRPENILLCNQKEFKIKISDFGNACESNKILIEPNLAKNCYTPLYYAPEILNAKKQKKFYSFSCDIWSLGVIMYILCFYKLPFYCKNQSANSSELRNKIRNGEYTLDKNTSISNDLLELIENMLKTSQENRIKIKDILKNHKDFRFDKETKPLCLII